MSSCEITHFFYLFEFVSLTSTVYLQWLTLHNIYEHFFLSICYFMVAFAVHEENFFSKHQCWRGEPICILEG